MKLAILAFDRFTDIDVFLPWDLLNRVPAFHRGDWQVQIVAVTPQVTSAAGLTIPAHADLSALADADAVLIASGPGVQGLLKGSDVLDAVRRLDPARQYIASMCSGSLLLAASGHLVGRQATTYYTRHKQLAAYGVDVLDAPFVLANESGTLATAAGCLAALDLVRWLVSGLTSPEVAEKVLRAVQPNGRT
jgi:transcriptional regulator GlxA family with amidase domain